MSYRVAPSYLVVAFTVGLAVLPSCNGAQLGQNDGSDGDVLAPGSNPADATDVNQAAPNDPPPTGGQTVHPFEAVPPVTYVRKVKTLLTGAAPEVNEVAIVQQNPDQLRVLVRQWMQTASYRSIMEEFFANQFQQSQALGSDFRFTMYDKVDVATPPSLLQAMRRSFAKTVTALNDEGAPFTETMTTTRLMMTTQLMSFYAYSDTSYASDSGVLSNRLGAKGTTRAITFRDKLGPVDTAAAADPNSPLYLTFQVPGLTGAYSKESTAVQAACNKLDPLVFTDARTFGRANSWGPLLWGVYCGAGWRNFAPATATTPETLCTTKGTTVPWFDPADTNDWRMVQIRPPNGRERVHEFFDFKTLRASNTLLMNAPRPGFFTTPAFLAQWGVNASNNSRAAANQTLIVALGEQIDGSDALPLTTPTAVDAAHAADTACFSCHQTLDPLRQFFRQSYTLSYSAQQDPKVMAVPAHLAFRGVSVPGKGVSDLAAALAAHPNFALAWTLKLCSWANSVPCEKTDPEVQRIAQAFAKDNFKWSTLVEEVFSSPIVTYTAPTLTAATNGAQVTVTRKAQLCNLLASRLGLTDPCAMATASADGKNTLPSRAAVLPSDNYNRGVLAGLYVTQPEPFYVANVENICALAAASAIDNGATSWASSAKPTAAIDKLVAVLMGVDADSAAEPTASLQAHYAAALAQKKTPTVALRSTFVAACSSVMVLTIGQ